MHELSLVIGSGSLGALGLGSFWGEVRLGCVGKVGLRVYGVGSEAVDQCGGPNIDPT